MRCEAVAQCERTAGHVGPHYAVLGPSSRRVWQDATFKMNFIEDKKDDQTS